MMRALLVVGMVGLGWLAPGCGRTPVAADPVCEADPEGPPVPVLGCERGACLTQQVEFRAAPTGVMVLLDRSCSMRTLVSDESKWSRAVTAVSGVAKTHDQLLHWGLSLFPQPETQSCLHEAPDVELGPAGAAQVIDLLQEASTTASPLYPSSDTCFTNIEHALYALSRLPELGARGVEDYVLLVTDGRSTGCTGLSEPIFDEEQLVEDMAARGVKTMVVGFESHADVEQLARLSEAGGAPLPPSGDYYQADIGDLEATLDTIARRLACSVRAEIDEPLSSVRVTLDGTPVPQSPTNGWTYDLARQEVLLHGEACNLLATGLVEAATVTMQCS